MPLAATVIGSASGSGDTLLIPLLTSVPRTSPSVFSAIIFFGSGVINPGLASVFDDAPPQDDYSFCLFEDGLNNYQAPGPTPNIGGIANDLTTENTITCSVPGGTTGWSQIIAVNVLGIGGFGGTGFSPLLPAGMAVGLEGLQEAERPVGGGGSSAPGVTWVYGGGFPPNLFDPSGATDTNWDWINGEIAFYPIFAQDPAPLGVWSWADGSITDWFQITDDFDGANYNSTALGMAAVIPGAAGPTLTGSWTGGQNKGSGEHGAAFLSGDGPGECTAPPVFGGPVFNHMHRAGAVGD